MPPAFGHGHADALSILLSANGHDLLVDPGTYTYTGHPEWRRYFRGTAAHNTVTVNGSDQAKQAGCFIWTKPFASRLIDASLENSSTGRLIAEHDGYSDSGIRHFRGLAWLQNEWLLVRDWISGEGEHDLALHWHLGGEASTLRDNRIKVQISDIKFAFRFEGGEIAAYQGNRDPIIGWRSPAYGIIKPITSLKISRCGPLPHSFTTFIMFPGGKFEPGDKEDALHWMKARVI
jgi:hypothetical protein